MLDIHKLELYQGTQKLFDGAGLQLFRGERVGLVGVNGSGKSTLLRLIRGEILPDAGEVRLQQGIAIASVAQEIVASERSALAFALDGDEELRALETVLAQNRHDAAYFQAQQRFEAIDGYGAKARAAQLLAGLGFAPERMSAPVSHFSGGWRMRLNLARALMRRADLLLLDEPTNHLDLEAILWLEQYLAKYPGGILLVSHDRDFLNSVVNRIAHLERGRLTLYTGDYDHFEETRAERLAQQQALHVEQNARAARLEAFIRRFGAKASKARQAQSRMKALARLERVARVQAAAGYDLALPSPERSPQVLLKLEQVGFRYGDDAPFLFQRLHLSLRPGDRIALLGPNGAGKSTLVKLLAGQLTASQGQRLPAAQLRIGYFAQHQLEYLDAGDTPMEHMQRLDPRAEWQQLRNFLGRYGFGGNDSERPIASFSGGEKSRLVLAGLAWLRPHLLLLDEPTNHLDLDMRDALILALQDYAGALVLVSHDRNLIRSCADQLLLVADGQARTFDGDLEDYRLWLATRAPPVSPAPSQAAPKTGSHAGKRLRSLRQQQEKLERQMQALEEQLAHLDARLAEPALYQRGDNAAAQALHVERQGMQAQHQELELRWLALEEESQALG